MSGSGRHGNTVQRDSRSRGTTRHGDQLQVTVATRDGTTAVAIRGELDLATVPIVERCVQSLDGDLSREVVLDLTELTFIDASGIQALVEAETALAGVGARLVVSSCPYQMRRLLRIAGLEDHFQGQ
jgi:anti-sigma B factor antagonist